MTEAVKTTRSGAVLVATVDNPPVNALGVAVRAGLKAAIEAAEADAAVQAVLIVGAGRMGAALARFLRVARPDLSLLLAEEGGLPNEEGATILAPGVWHADVPPERREEAERTRVLLGDALTPCGLLDLQGQAGPGTRPVSEVLGPDLLDWIDAGVLPHVRLDGRAGVYSAGQLTLGHAQTAIREGADLMLNVRAELHGHELHGPGPGGAARLPRR